MVLCGLRCCSERVGAGKIGCSRCHHTRMCRHDFEADDNNRPRVAHARHGACVYDSYRRSFVPVEIHYLALENSVENQSHLLRKYKNLSWSTQKSNVV